MSSTILSSTSTENENNERAPFLIGVTGLMTLQASETESLKSRFRTLFRFLREGDQASLNPLLTDLVPDHFDPSLRSAYQRALSRWTGLGRQTPIVVMCNLAPGVDNLVANLVLDEFAHENFQLNFPLAFPLHRYLSASTFVRRDGNDQPLPGNEKRQKELLDLLAKLNVLDSDLAELADGTESLPKPLFEALKKVCPRTFFPVRLKGDPAADSQALEDKWCHDLEKKELRNHRYYAAGEYLTVSSHLLIAAWNGLRDGSPSGTSAIVEARLSGPRHGVLEATAAVALPHGGPVWHILANRPDCIEKPTVACIGNANLPLPPQRILHPVSGSDKECGLASIIAPHQAADIALQSDRLQLLARIGENLRNFNSAEVPRSRDRVGDLVNKLADNSGQQTLGDRLSEQSPLMSQRLRAISNLYSRSSELTAHYQRQVTRTLAQLFWITIVAAVGMHLFTHWHPRAHHKTDTPVAIASDHPQEEHLNGVQLFSGWMAMLLSLSAIAYFGWQRSKKYESNDHDARAISEGLRIQFFWNLAGLGASVSANYMSRHRSELDWIRAVIRASSFPYDLWKTWFNQLPAETKLLAFRSVQKSWIQDQLGYFQRACHREHHRLHVWHKFGAVLALSGLLLYLKLIASASWSSVASLVETLCHAWLALVLLVATAIYAYVSAARHALKSSSQSHGNSHGNGHGEHAIFPEWFRVFATSRKRITEAWGVKTEGNLWLWCLKLVDCSWQALASAGNIALETVGILVPTGHDSALFQTRFRYRIISNVFGFLTYIPLALAIACCVRSICHFTADLFGDSFPSPMTLCVIAAGTQLLVGALSVAWAEKRMYSELAYQYGTMAALFESADRQIDQSVIEFQSAISTNDADRQAASIERIQALLFELGQEALDENAEWLLLHRARPMEPVMAG